MGGWMGGEGGGGGTTHIYRSHCTQLFLVVLSKKRKRRFHGAFPYTAKLVADAPGAIILRT